MCAYTNTILSEFQLTPIILQDCEDPHDALSLQVNFHKRTVQSVAFLRKRTCNWASGKWRVFSPGAAARHRGQTRAHMQTWCIRALVFHFSLEIGRLRRPISNRTSPPDVQLHIGRLLPVSCVDIRLDCLV